MKKLYLISLVLILSSISCVSNQKKEPDKGNIPSLEPPKALNDDWSKWLVGSWQGTAKSDFGEHKDWAKGNCRLNIELALDNQFLIRKGQSKVTSLSDDYIKQLKGQNLSDSDIEKIRNSTFESMEIYTIAPKTGEITAYLFDSLRCVAKGTGKREDNKETINWVWSVQGQGTSTRVTEKINDDRFVSIEKYAMPDGSAMEDRTEMVRK
jgi:hypothetical protein